MEDYAERLKAQLEHDKELLEYYKETQKKAFI